MVISTPFLDRRGGEIEIDVPRQNGGYRLTDDGSTIADRRSNGVELTNAARRDHVVRIRKRLRRAAAARRADFSPRRRDFSPGAVRTSPKISSHIRRLAELPQKKHDLVQAILAIDDRHATAKEHVLEFFREDVEELLPREDIPFVRDLELSGRSGLDHKFDIMLPADKRHPERVLKAINTLRRDTAMTYAFSVDDVLKVRGRDTLGAPKLWRRRLPAEELGNPTLDLLRLA